MKFENPWKDLPINDLHRTTVQVSRAVMSKISRVHSQQGVLQTTVYLLITKLTDELERNGLTEYDAAGYEHLVSNCRIVFDGAKRSSVAECAAGKVSNGPAKAVAGNDGPGDAGLAPVHAGHEAAPDANEPPRKPVGKRRNAKAGKETK